MNVIGSRADGWWRDRPGARRALVGRLAEFGRAGAGADEVTVVFDGPEVAQEVAEARRAGVGCRFAGPGRDAADRVVAAMAAELGPACTVATSDGALAAQARAAGASVVGAGAFLRMLATRPGPGPQADPGPGAS
jgi:predicted RNA-binding protein with PIN domain